MRDAAIGVTHTETKEIELFLHAQGAKPKVLTEDLGDKLSEVLLQSEIIRDGQDELFVFIGECEEALREPDDLEDGVDEHNPVDIDLTLGVLEIDRHRHVHCHHCRHVSVEVNFGGTVKHHRFSPATTIGVVTRWARKKFPNPMRLRPLSTFCSCAISPSNRVPTSTSASWCRHRCARFASTLSKRSRRKADQ